MKKRDPLGRRMMIIVCETSSENPEIHDFMEALVKVGRKHKVIVDRAVVFGDSDSVKTEVVNLRNSFLNYLK
ncbi:hypothetical protein B9Q13_04490 [Candidatus Marsarchaeota G2 archaeon ECH_B_SAG-G16]|uniref:Uncharacterized protein n=1 Tax=Candidatus Marsarchaeota G2 archaeon ECH_B_SAG-G16 TaxID=1978167 RepID=A0A2R6C0X5_9ARCH|nr:MAG: hypothetical protein B9Q13_04490 [Candidatus Marsarchaeota G2 archaeon ECH_B_SAG-G16]